MDEELNNNRFISKTNSGFPDYLDFDKLRTEGITYLGQLAGKVWTDHNVHDPGITILEMLCYATLDLGYRTNLPVKDILARTPEDTGSDDNFLTPAQILTNNPLTITDFRKLLVDINGVKNAWLEVAQDEHNFCKSQEASGNDLCQEYINGIYHVYIDLEKNLDTEFSDTLAKTEYEQSIRNNIREALMSHRNLCEDFKDSHTLTKTEYEQSIRNNIREALMSHRNLCEDFKDITFLCKIEMGVCAEIQIAPQADAEAVYLEVMEQLRIFFSPSPKFYTLPQLLEKGKSIEEIFAGRPYNLNESHGFIDTEEFEKLRLKKSIHLSDVYAVILNVAGVEAVRKLRLQRCLDGLITPAPKEWEFQLPENHVPDFSVDCSGFQFIRNGMPLGQDLDQYRELLELNFTNNGKILYQAPSSHLDLEIPKGIFRPDLGEYDSIQNEFPRVYGIGDGDLPDNVPTLRKAQSLQLKGYLLFFDQLLANYLAQLQNIRQLFAFSHHNPKEEPHTYFTKELTTVPELDKLLRFKASEQNHLPNSGTTLVTPVGQEVLQTDPLKLEDIEAYRFKTAEERNIIIQQWRDDLYYGNFTTEIVTAKNECVYYYLIGTSQDLALISSRYYGNEQLAGQAAASVQYIGTFQENYHTYNAPEGKYFSFDLEMNVSGYLQYLQKITEDREMFRLRRHGFLDHLLSRFAESFTDFALLSYGIHPPYLLDELNIKQKERYLTHYPELSSNRGKGYDYRVNGWNNPNVSGLEKRFKALSGMKNLERHSLCNFLVEKYKEKYIPVLKLAGWEPFVTSKEYEKPAEAAAGASSLFRALSNQGCYQMDYIGHEQAYQLSVLAENDLIATSPVLYGDRSKALASQDYMVKVFSNKPAEEHVVISKFIYKSQLTNYQGQTIRTCKQPYNTEPEAFKEAKKKIRQVNNLKIWDKPEAAKDAVKSLIAGRDLDTQKYYINVDAFKIDVNDTIVGKPDVYTFDLLDNDNTFKLQSQLEFKDQNQAKTGSYKLLSALTDKSNYRIEPRGKQFIIQIKQHEQLIAGSATRFRSEDTANKALEKIYDITCKNQYQLLVTEVPHRWKFQYHLAQDPIDPYKFESNKEYTSSPKAYEASQNFHKKIDGLQLRIKATKLVLAPAKSSQDVASCQLKAHGQVKKGELAEIKEQCETALEQRKAVADYHSNPEAFERSYGIDALSKTGTYVYRLVDQDHLHGVHPQDFKTQGEAEAACTALMAWAKRGYRYLEICLGGDILIKQIDPLSGAGKYHYQIKPAKQLGAARSGMALFQSIKGYDSEQKAQEAFLDNYLIILRKAFDPTNYGLNKFISTDESITPNYEDCSDAVSQVFVPQSTLDAFGGYEVAAVRELAKLVSSYPIRYLEKDCYRYTLYDAFSETDHWLSDIKYSTPGQALEQFNFLLILLKYPGNCYIHFDQDTCSFKLKMREVLAESTARYVEEKDAWGKEGIEKFIAVSQSSSNSFHTYVNPKNCYHSFYVACQNIRLIHPYRYDSITLRDHALQTMYASLKRFDPSEAITIHYLDDQPILKDFNSTPIAKLSIPEDKASDCSFTYLMQAILDHKNYRRAPDGSFWLTDWGGNNIAQPFEPGVTLEQWKNQLIALAYYYPLIPTSPTLEQWKKPSTDPNASKPEKFCVKIRIPGFNDFKGHLTELQPCSCDDKPSINPCDVAWINDCCYSTCKEALGYYWQVLRLLSDYRNYRPVFDCPCGSYGINFHLASEVVAFNPQCYSSPEMTCEAVERAKGLVNCEGLHLVEHLLLRPHCEEDCLCDFYRQTCDDPTNCQFPREPGDPDDPCDPPSKICFTPGPDPFSFIATIALPAWPQRLKKAENRALIENMLRREAPAHIMLRILWLAPHDLCCFENFYKNWQRALAKKSDCGIKFPQCDFLNFLFNRNYECYEEVGVCQTCPEEGIPIDPCFETQPEDDETCTFIDQINELFCWEPMNCDDYQFQPCLPKVVEAPEIEAVAASVIEAAVATSIKTETTPQTVVKKLSQKILKKQSQKTLEKPSQKVTEKQPEKVLKKLPSSKEKFQFINGRLAKYRSQIEQVVKESQENPLAIKGLRFLSNPNPTITQAEKLMAEIAGNKKPSKKGQKPLIKKQIKTLMEHLTLFCLDHYSFRDQAPRKTKAFNSGFAKITGYLDNPSTVLNRWEPADVQKYNPTWKVAEVKALLTK